MIFGKHINRYYLRYAGWLLLGVVALLTVDYAQLKVPEFFRMVVNGMNGEPVLIDGVKQAFTLEVLLDKICLPLIVVILVMVVGRFLWRICFFGAAIKVETDLRNRMFDHHSRVLWRWYFDVFRCFGIGIAGTL